ncbi:hypothetical protein BDF20DRAFT_822231 [Mycotypha africana]|uniref:uncharacterized protein n=1 Tax=Mycotypha africana TaxID=64632 RepID=UPI0022FFFEC5|nr:uncharacterized protein BDF20DRAFT_822231 [Mycotypha africana]KAI8975716.1 hypothetical protein BDF20DRAFT_822231 [Mycotypha africana]
MTNRAPSPPSTGYCIIDIRNSGDTGSTDTDLLPAARPPSPPESFSNSSEDAFNSSDLADSILESIEQKRSIPTYILYDKRGLQLFDEITQLDDCYYLTGAELDILVRKSEEIITRLKDGSVIFELGAGALRKTQVFLRAIERKKVHIKYYALDLDQQELNRSLSSLGEFQYVELYGLLGTYDQGIPWISKHFTNRNIHKSFLWMGSSIGNQTHLESALFLRKIQRICLEPGDFMAIGFDKRNEPSKIELAYDDSYGVTRDFIMNGLDHINTILKRDKNDLLFKRNQFAYHSIYQEKQGRHLSHYQALEDVVLKHKTAQKKYNITIHKDELIHVEHSYKYSMEEIESILSAADLNIVDYWVDSKDQYRLVLAESRPFNFERNVDQVRRFLYPPKEVFEEEPIDCYTCNEGQYEFSSEDNVKEEPLDLYTLDKTWPSNALPTLHEWQELWNAWDLVTQHMMNHKTMLFERPIALRHPFIFYLGHIPAFLDIQLSRHQVDAEITADMSTTIHYTEPLCFAEIFERGIDPDMEDPTQCHPHSEVPTNEKDWPSVERILTYQAHVRQRLQNLLNFWQAEAFRLQSSSWVQERKRQARIVWMCFEHEAMHLETLLYMLVQSPNMLPPKGVAIPNWKLVLDMIRNTSDLQPGAITPLTDAPFITIPAGTVTVGHNDKELADLPSTASVAYTITTKMNDDNLEFGWDNENPKRQMDVSSFEIQSRPVTNGEYYVYLQEIGSDNIPASWSEVHEHQYAVKTVFGLCPLVYAQHWPVQITYNEAADYAKYKGCRLPTEAELVYFRTNFKTAQVNKDRGWPNIGFKHWSPTDVDNDAVHTIGDVWEWTETIWEEHEGFEASQLYPGYSADFFDGKHRVILGGSWATHPRIAERTSFRNWYQSGYPYVFCGFRLCR